MWDTIINHVKLRFSKICRRYLKLRGLHFVGLKNIPTGGYVVVSNHRSVMDVFMFAAALNHNDVVAWISGHETKSLLRRLIFAEHGLLRAIPIARNHPNPRLPERTQRVLDDGCVIWVAPEGTRSRDGKLGKGRLGVAWVLAKLNHPTVVPVGVTYHRTSRKPRGLLQEVLLPSKCTVNIGRPFELVPDKPMEARADLVRLTTEIMSRIANLLPSDERGRYDLDSQPDWEHTREKPAP